jgi:hypothetical protein
MKIVINTEYGGFGLSAQAFEAYLKLKNIEYVIVPNESTFIGQEFYSPNNEYISQYDIVRDDPDLVQVVELLGEQSWGNFASLKVVEIPDGTNWYIHEYDGIESIHEVHQSWS